MISDLFFYGKLKDADNLIIYEEEFVLLYLTIKLKYYTYFEKEDVERVLVEFYGEKNIKSKKIPEVCEKFFNTYGKQYCFKEEHKENEYYQKSFSFWEEITKNSNIDSALIYSGIENEVLDNLFTKEEYSKLHEAIDELRPREKEILSLRFGLNGYEELTQKETAEKLGISQSYISRLEKRIIKKLKNNLKENLKV